MMSVFISEGIAAVRRSSTAGFTGHRAPLSTFTFNNKSISRAHGKYKFYATGKERRLLDSEKTVAIDDNDNRTIERSDAPCDMRVLPLLHRTKMEMLSTYASLMKVRLSGFVILSSMVGYAMAPDVGASSLGTLGYLSVGTALCVCCANAINQWVEAPFDSQMRRTQNRALVVQQVTPVHAFGFGGLVGGLGTLVLYQLVNPLTAVLGLANIGIYTMLYTPSKRLTVYNTWCGAVVGAIPPIMGYTAATNSLGIEALLLGSLLYAWQFPHFNALSWNLRQDYSKAGYVMASVTHPQLCKRVALRYALALYPLSYACVYASPVLADTSFLVSSTLVNTYLLYHAVNFYTNAHAQSARNLFFASIIHLPLILIALIIAKRAPVCADDSGDSDDSAASTTQIQSAYEQ